MRTKARTFRTSTMVLAAFLGALLMASQVDAKPNLWPKKKGELCWVADAENSSGNHEYSLVRAWITDMGNDHYLFHGQAYRVEGLDDLTKLGGYDLQALGGNVEFDPEYELKIRKKKLADQEVELNKAMARAETMAGKTQVIEAETLKLVSVIVIAEGL